MLHSFVFQIFYKKELCSLAQDGWMKMVQWFLQTTIHTCFSVRNAAVLAITEAIEVKMPCMVVLQKLSIGLCKHAIFSENTVESGCCNIEFLWTMTNRGPWTIGHTLANCRVVLSWMNSTNLFCVFHINNHTSSQLMNWKHYFYRKLDKHYE